MIDALVKQVAVDMEPLRVVEKIGLRGTLDVASGGQFGHISREKLREAVLQKAEEVCLRRLC